MAAMLFNAATVRGLKPIGERLQLLFWVHSRAADMHYHALGRIVVHLNVAVVCLRHVIIRRLDDRAISLAVR